MHLYFCFCSSYNGILCDRCIKPFPPHYNSSTFSSPLIMSDAAWSSSSPPFTWCITVILKGRCYYIPCFKKLSSFLLLYRDMLQREVLLACGTTTASALHTTTCTDASPKLLQFVTILLQHILCTLVLQLYLGLLLQYSGVFIWLFCKGNVHCVLLPGDQQFQLISFQTCFHYVTEWKAHLLRDFTGLYFAKLLTCRRLPALA